MNFLRSAFLIFALLTVGCGGSPSGPSTEPASFSSTVSFGECLPSSYCTSRLEICPGEAVFTYESRERPPVVRRRPLEPLEWRRLVSALDLARLRALPSVLGCPDCADGGAESLSVTFTNGPAITVTFEYNHDVPAIQALLNAVRAIRHTFGGYPADAASAWEVQ